MADNNEECEFQFMNLAEAEEYRQKLSELFGVAHEQGKDRYAGSSSVMLAKASYAQAAPQILEQIMRLEDHVRYNLLDQDKAPK